MFLDKFTKKQYKAYKNDIVVGIYHSKETVDKDLASGYIDCYKEVPEQIQFNGMFYDKYGAPKEFYFFMIKLKWLEFYCRFIKTPITILIEFIKGILLPSFIILFLLILGFLCFIGYKHIPSNKCWIDFVSAIAPTIIGICSIIIAIYSIFYTKKSLIQQQEQWIKNEFIKREAQILIDFREKFCATQNSIFWFLDTFMQPYRCNNFIPTEEQLTIKIETFNYHYNKLRELNNLYNKNQLIYRKYNIDSQMAYITTLLKSITLMEGNNICAVFSQKTESCMEYIRPECIKFANSFLTMLDFEFAPKNKDITKTLQKLSKQDNRETRLQEYIDKARSDFTNLMFKLDEITTYYSGKIPDNLKRREMYYCPTAEDYFNQRKNNQKN